MNTTYLTLNSNKAKIMLGIFCGAFFVFGALFAGHVSPAVAKDGCFLAGTSITTDNGVVAIENIKVGDRVLSFNVLTDQNEYAYVTKVYDLPDTEEYYSINNKIRVTGEHPFYVNGEWVEVKNLKTGDLLTTEGGGVLAIRSIDKVVDTQPRYNFEVDGTHTYFAEGVLVHNKGGGDSYCDPAVPSSGFKSGGCGGCSTGGGGGGGTVTTTDTPDNPSCSSFSCISAANICGDINTGTQNSCTGNICSASVPANPSGTCSVATACGVDATGFNGCSGSCNITSYPFCTTVQNPDGDGEIEWITVGDGNSGNGGGYGATDILLKILAKPVLVAKGKPTVVRWLSTETESCEVTAPNGDSWTGTAGEELTSDIEEETTYILECVGYDDSIVTDSVTVRIVPVWEEF